MDILRSRSRLTGHKDSVNVVFCGAGEVVSGSEDGTVRVWSAASGRCEKLIRAGGAVTGVSACESGVYAVACGQSVALYDLRECKDVVVEDAPLWRAEGVDAEEVNYLEFRAEKLKTKNKRKPTRFLCCSGDSGVVRVLEVTKGLALKDASFCETEAHPNSVCSMCVFHPAFPNVLVSAGLDCRVGLYDFYGGKSTASLTPAHDAKASEGSTQLVNPPFVYCLDTVTVGSAVYLVCGLGSGEVVVYNASKKEPVEVVRLTGHGSAVNQVRFAYTPTPTPTSAQQDDSRRGSSRLLLLWSSSNDGNIACWEGFLDAKGEQQQQQQPSEEEEEAEADPTDGFAVAFTTSEKLVYRDSFRYMRHYVRHSSTAVPAKINWMAVSEEHQALFVADTSNDLTRYQW